jgi:hypothetical protein
MHATIERFSGGVIRLFRDDSSYGDPYEYALAFKNIDEDTIEVVGVFANEHGQSNLPLPHQWRVMKDKFQEDGLRIRFERKSGAKRGIREVE